MESDLEKYKKLYQKLRKKLLDADLTVYRSDSKDKIDFLASCSEDMSKGLGVSSESMRRLLNILQPAYHPDTNPEVSHDDAIDMTQIRDEIKILNRKGVVEKFKGQRVAPEITDSLLSRRRESIIRQIEQKRSSQDGKLENQINELITEYLRRVKDATSLSEINSLFNNFSTTNESLLSDYKKRFFEENGISNQSDFKIPENMNIDDLQAKLQKMVTERRKNATKFINEKVAELSSQINPKLRPSVTRIGRNYIDLLENDNITEEEAEQHIQMDLKKINADTMFYLDRVDELEQLLDMARSINSFKLYQKVQKMFEVVCNNDSFNAQVSKLKDEIESISSEGLSSRIFQNVTNNYKKAISDSPNERSYEIYGEFCHLLKEYDEGRLGVDSLCELNGLFKDAQQDEKIISYVTGKYTPGDDVNPDLIFIKTDGHGVYDLKYRTDTEFLGQRYYKETQLLYVGNNSKKQVGTLTQFLCNSSLDLTTYTNDHYEVVSLYTWDDTCLTYSKERGFDFKSKELLRRIYHKADCKNGIDNELVFSQLMQNIAKKLNLATMVSGGSYSATPNPSKKSTM